MFKQIFRITFVTFIWKQYKRVIVSTATLFAYLWLVGSIHADYLSYAELQADEVLIGYSFLLKWAALIAGVILYLAYHFIRGARRRGKSQNPDASSKTTALKKANSIADGEQQGPDPFAEIRSKRKLRSRAEIMMDKHDR